MMRTCIKAATLLVFLVSSLTLPSITEPQGKTPNPARPVRSTTIFQGMEYVWIPPGSLQMGSSLGESGRDPDEGPVHRVILREGFWMSRTEVTNAQFCTFLNVCGNRLENDAPWLDIEDDDCQILATGDGFAVRSGYEDHPVVETSWWGARAYAAWVGARLPSESEWEYACRAGTSTAFTTGACITSDQANFNGQRPLLGCAQGEYRRGTVSVGSFAPNAWGLYDMPGNVWEWCEDVWHDSYAGAPPNGDAWLRAGDPRVRVVRGGSWYSTMKTLRSAYRHFTPPDYSSGYTGFRLIRDRIE